MALASSTSSRILSLPGMTGSLALAISWRARFLSPIRRMIEAGGPMKVMPGRSRRSRRSGRSRPGSRSPGWMASALVISATLRMLGMFR